nr:V-type ATP synthase subunit E [uncultured Acetobacterium sp.]
MTGIEKIIEQIGVDAAETARATIEAAQNSAQEEKSSAIEKASAQCAQIRSQSKKDVADWLERARSAGMLKKRQLILSAKQELISEIIEAAHHRLLEMTDNAYFTMLLKMIEKYALPQKGELLFSPVDYQRLPTDFQESVNAVFQKKNASLVISNQNRSIDGGFVLVYGEIEVNCSFAALFDSAKDQLQDRVNEVLFL